jgi:MFS family permease
LKFLKKKFPALRQEQLQFKLGTKLVQYVFLYITCFHIHKYLYLLFNGKFFYNFYFLIYVMDSEKEEKINCLNINANNDESSLKSNEDSHHEISITSFDNDCKKNKKVKNELESIIDLIPFNITHFKLCLLLCMFCFADGCIMISTSLTLPILKDVWKLKDYEKSLIGGSIFIGFMIGSVLTGIIASKNRKLSIYLGILFALLGGYLSIYMSNAFQFFIYNALIGIGLGLIGPAMFSQAIEMCSFRLRAYVITYVWLLFPLGEIFICNIAKHYKIYEIQTNNWQKVFINRFYLIALITPFSFLIMESPKFLFSVNKFPQAIQNLKKFVGDRNQAVLDNQKISTIIDQYKDYNKNLENSKIKYGALTSYIKLFQREYLALSVKIFISWVVVAYLFYGILYILPYLMQEIQMQGFQDGSNKLKPSNIVMNSEKYNQIINDIMLGCALEIPVTLVNAIIPNIKSIGRVGTLKIGFSLNLILSLMSYYFQSYTIIISSILKALVGLSFNSISIFTSEAFPTYLKVTALGLSNVFCRLGGVATPFVDEFLLQYSIYSPFLGFSLASLIGLIIAFLLPFETLGKEIF